MIECGNSQRPGGGRLIRTDLAGKCDDIAHAYVAYGRDGRVFGGNNRTQPRGAVKRENDSVDGIPDVCLAVFFLEREAEHHVGGFVWRGTVEGVQSVRAADGICRKAEIARHAVDCGDRHQRLGQRIDGQRFVGRGEADGRRDGRLVRGDAFHDRGVEAERGRSVGLDFQTGAAFPAGKLRRFRAAPGSDAGQDLVRPVARPRFIRRHLGVEPRGGCCDTGRHGHYEGNSATILAEFLDISRGVHVVSLILLVVALLAADLLEVRAHRCIPDEVSVVVGME